MDHWRKYGWTVAGMAFVAGFCVVMRWSLRESDADALSPDDQSLDLVAAPSAGEAPATALVPPSLPDNAPADGWGRDRPWSGTTYHPAVQAVPRNLKLLAPEDSGAAREILPPAPALRVHGAQDGGMATFLASTATTGLVGAMVRSLAGGT